VDESLTDFFRWLFNDGETSLNKREFFTGTNYENVNKNKVLDLILILVKKTIWDCKLRFCVPNFHILKNYFLEEYGKLYKNSAVVRNFTLKSDFFLNREDIRF